MISDEPRDRSTPVHLEDYFDFLRPDDIRLRGHRIGIESILYAYIHQAMTPEEIAAQFPTLTLDQVYATILYYLRNKERIHDYLTAWLEHERRMVAEQAANPPPVVQRLRRIRAEREAAGTWPVRSNTG